MTGPSGGVKNILQNMQKLTGVAESLPKHRGVHQRSGVIRSEVDSRAVIQSASGRADAGVCMKRQSPVSRFSLPYTGKINRNQFTDGNIHEQCVGFMHERQNSNKQLQSSVLNPLICTIFCAFGN